jgi:Ferritin-like
MASATDPVHPHAHHDPMERLTPSERALVRHIDETWTRERALAELKHHLQTAIEVELATLPIYLFTYYSINRTPSTFPSTDVSRYADEAGAVILSAAVEEMLHLSLSSNILFALGTQPVLYGKSPGPFPTNLPGEAKLGPDHEPVRLTLAKFSCEHLWKFLEIEYPATADAPPEGQDWHTIGQIYSYIRCIIASKLVLDADFEVGDATRRLQQIDPGNYAPNSIDTAYAKAAFRHDCPVSAPAKGSAAHVVGFANRGDSHAGRAELIRVSNKKQALQAIATICYQGEGFALGPDDDPSKGEMSHYYKFLTLQSKLVGYDPRHEKLAPHPAPPAPPERQLTPDEVRSIVFDFPEDPIAAGYAPRARDVANVASGLYQYMLIMTESIFLQPPAEQKRYFNVALHRSMIWILDKLIQAMRAVPVDASGGTSLAPTFENVNLGPRDQAFGTLQKMCAELDARYGGEGWYASDLKYYVDMIPTLTDVSAFWAAPTPPACDVSKYAGAPKFPATPPSSVGEHEVRHACMGLNHCAGQGRTRDNACAGQGTCSTALAYDFADPAHPTVSDHTCKVLNACNGQGGCGLYGTGAEQDQPGANECATLGGCATPVNAERFSTDGPNQGKSVWLRAREVFKEKVWPGLREKDPKLPADPPAVPGTAAHPDLFEYGPTIEWIESYSGHGMTACGSSGMSGAGSCA